MAVNPQRIQQARLKANMSRADLAYAIRDATGGRIKATERSVRRWEKSEHAPADGVVPAIAAATGTEISYFYGRDDDDSESAEDDDLARQLANVIAALVRAELQRSNGPPPTSQPNDLRQLGEPTDAGRAALHRPGAR